MNTLELDSDAIASHPAQIFPMQPDHMYFQSSEQPFLIPQKMEVITRPADEDITLIGNAVRYNGVRIGRRYAVIIISDRETGNALLDDAGNELQAKWVIAERRQTEQLT